MMKKRFMVAVAIGLATVLVLAAPTVVKKLSAYGYVGRSGDATLVVDMDLARLRGKERLIPLQVWLGHTGAKTLYVNRKSFTLKDPEGVTHPLASVKEAAKLYGSSLVGNDYGYYSRLTDYASMLYLSCVYIPGVAFFANPSGRPDILYDKVELPRRTFVKALLYFKNPAGKAKGKYTLIYNDPKSGTKIEIPFSIPWLK